MAQTISADTLSSAEITAIDRYSGINILGGQLYVNQVVTDQQLEQIQSVLFEGYPATISDADGVIINGQTRKENR